MSMGKILFYWVLINEQGQQFISVVADKQEEIGITFSSN